MKIFLIVSIIITNTNAVEFYLQHLGTSVSVEEASERPFCGNKYCLEDAELLFYAATQNSSVDPCVDFKEFSMGTFIKYRAHHERNHKKGFEEENKQIQRERLRKLVASKTNDDEPRVSKVMKNFFRKCVSSSKCTFKAKNIF